MKRLLMISPMPLYPANDGGRVRIRELATHLSDRYDVHVSAPAGGDPPLDAPFTLHETPSHGARQFADARVPWRIAEIVRHVRPDALMLEYVWLGLHAAPIARLHRLPLLVDAWDVATTRLRRAGSKLWPLVSAYERLVLRTASRVFAVSDVDRRSLVELGAPAAATSIVPNGVDTRAYRPGSDADRQMVRARLGVGDGERMLLFFGQLSYAPNADAVDVLARAIMPRLPDSYRLFVAGRGPVEELRARYGGRRVAFVGPVDSLVPYLAAADAVPVPIRHGSGTRLKILESVACGVPTVSTPVGCEGIDVGLCGGTLIVRSVMAGFADAIQEAAMMPHRQPGDAFAGTYDWRSIAERIAI